MTSLIFGSIYMGHQAVIEHRRNKQREKNYQRWEGLRDEYDDQKRHSLDSNLDRPASNTDSAQHELFTLRDRQEAGDARTSWRTQESWSHLRPQPQPDPSYTASAPMLPNQFTGAISRAELKGGASSSPQTPLSRSPSRQPQPQQPQQLRYQKTGSTWDEALPARLQVSRRSFEDYTYPASASPSTSNLPPRFASSSMTPQPSTGSAATSSAESLVGENYSSPLPKRDPPTRRVQDVEVVESPFEWWKQ